MKSLIYCQLTLTLFFLELLNDFNNVVIPLAKLVYFLHYLLFIGGGSKSLLFKLCIKLCLGLLRCSLEADRGPPSCRHWCGCWNSGAAGKYATTYLKIVPTMHAVRVLKSM